MEKNNYKSYHPRLRVFKLKEMSLRYVDVSSRFDSKNATDPILVHREADPKEQGNPILDYVDSVIPQIVNCATNKS